MTVAAGVCAACQHSPGCIYEDSSNRTILQCEQFEFAFPAEASPPVEDDLQHLFKVADDYEGYAGLCSNCENRRECIYPKPEGGVWHCDEYA